MLAEVARELPRDASLRLGEVRLLLDKIEEELRQLSHELRPTILDDLGLIAALQFLADNVSKRSGLRIDVEGSVERLLPSGVETALYRSVQEALTNVTKHAQATAVRIQLLREVGVLRCSIRDDGVGFDVPTVLARRGGRGLGLIGIRERLAAIGGVLEIQSVPGHGAELRLRLPLET